MNHPSPTLEDLIALNNEIAALVRAGVPLELGLRGLSITTGARLSKLSTRIADRMTAGATLPDALAEEGPVISPIYTATIKAGLASGRLPEALESVAESGQLTQEMRRRVMLASLYPLICLGVAYFMYCTFITLIAPRILDAVETFPKTWPIDLLRFLYRYREFVTVVIPLTVLAVLLVTFALRNSLMRPVWQFLTSFHWVTGSSLTWAQFTRLLAFQIDQQTPLPMAFVLAADATSNVRWQREARKVSEELTSGATFASALQSATSMPPLLRWTLAASEKQGTLAATLRHLTEVYHRRVLRRTAIVKTCLPIVITVCFTGTIGFFYGMAFFVPLRVFLIRMAQE